ncbi:hypothetical protein T440DRAFT_400506, partial [Plenodomus tracheiphilus IPT5]
PQQLTTHPTPSPPRSIPQLLYRIHRPTSQTRYSFATGFISKNQSTILSISTSVSRFGLAHLHQQTNISSPFISVYDDLAHAESVAGWMARMGGGEVVVVCVDSRYLGPGPVFRAEDLLRGEAGGGGGGGEWLHRGEYLVMYRIPVQAVRDQRVVARGEGEGWRAVGVVGKVES